VLAALAVASTALPALSLIMLMLFGLHLVWQVATLKPQGGARALRLFKSNRDAGLLLFATFALGALHPFVR
jgi:4-hydroxybenzoate polyprenyltransferase